MLQYCSAMNQNTANSERKSRNLFSCFSLVLIVNAIAVIAKNDVSGMYNKLLISMVELLSTKLAAIIIDAIEINDKIRILFSLLDRKLLNILIWFMAGWLKNFIFIYIKLPLKLPILIST